MDKLLLGHGADHVWRREHLEEGQKPICPRTAVETVGFWKIERQVVGQDAVPQLGLGPRHGIMCLGQFLNVVGASYHRIGYRRLHVILRRDGHVLNRKRTQRLYREEGLSVRRRRSRKRAIGTRAPLVTAAMANARWSVDFVHDQFAGGRRFRILNVIDDVTKESLAAVVDTSISGRRVARELTALIERRGKPGVIVSDNVLCRERFAV